METRLTSNILANGDTFSINAPGSGDADNSLAFVHTFSSRRACESSRALIRIGAFSGRRGNLHALAPDASEPTSTSNCRTAVNAFALKAEIEALTVGVGIAFAYRWDTAIVDTFPSFFTRGNPAICWRDRRYWENGRGFLLAFSIHTLLT